MFYSVYFQRKNNKKCIYKNIKNAESELYSLTIGSHYTSKHYIMH